MTTCGKGKMGLIAFAVFLALFYLISSVAEARVGGGRSFGSRGSRSFGSSPGSPSRSYQDSRSYNTPSRTSPYAAPQSQPGGGFMRSLAGGVLGGMAGALLFRSLGFGGTGGLGGGIGMMDILLLGAILYGIYWFIKKRRQAATAANAPMAYGSTGNREAFNPGSYAPPIRDIPPATGNEAGDGLSSIRQSDYSFDEKRFKDAALDNFFTIQGAWASRDMTGVRDLLTDEIYDTIQQDAETLRAKKQINKLDNIAVRSVDITEAWQEGGRDFITIRFYANLLDYTVDEASGEVVAGSKTEPVKFLEFWTFTRSEGSNPWRLSAVNQES